MGRENIFFSGCSSTSRVLGLGPRSSRGSTCHPDIIYRVGSQTVDPVYAGKIVSEMCPISLNEDYLKSFTC